MRNGFVVGVVVIIGGGWAGSVAAQTKPEIIAKADVPAVVSKGIDKAAPETEWVIHTTWDERIGTMDRLFGRDAHDRLVEVMAKADGAVIDVRTRVEIADVPKVVRDALAAKMPDFRPKATQAVGRESAAIIYYRFVGKTEDATATVIIASVRPRVPILGSTVPYCVRRRAFGVDRQNVRDIVMALHGVGDPAAQATSLGRVVFDLLMEVEALRRAVQELSDRAGPAGGGEDIFGGLRHGVSGPRTAYAAAYVETAWLTHCAAGPSGGWEKLLAEYYSQNAPPSEWCECLMLKRLGFSDDEIASYMESARGAETMT